jgi:hypothetical protein
MRSTVALVMFAAIGFAGGVAEAEQFYCYATATGGTNKVTRALGADTTLYQSSLRPSRKSCSNQGTVRLRPARGSQHA